MPPCNKKKYLLPAVAVNDASAAQKLARTTYPSGQGRSPFLYRGLFTPAGHLPDQNRGAGTWRQQNTKKKICTASGPEISELRLERDLSRWLMLSVPPLPARCAYSRAPHQCDRKAQRAAAGAPNPRHDASRSNSRQAWARSAFLFVCFVFFGCRQEKTHNSEETTARPLGAAVPRFLPAASFFILKSPGTRLDRARKTSTTAYPVIHQRKTEDVSNSIEQARR